MRKLVLAALVLGLLLPLAAHAQRTKSFQLKTPAGALAGRVDVDWDEEDQELSVELSMKGAQPGKPYRVSGLIGGKWTDLGTPTGAPDGSLVLMATTTPDDPDETKIVLPAATRPADFGGFKVYQGKTVVAECQG